MGNSNAIITINENDLDVKLTDEQTLAFAEWFYSNYMDSIVECARQWALKME